MKHRFRARLAGAALVVVLSSAIAARGEAAPAPPADEPADTQFAQHMQNGITLYQLKHYAPALVEFQAAYAAKARARALVNAALCLRELMRYPEAVAALEKALTEMSDPLDEENQKAARQAISEMQPLIAYLRIEVTPQGSTVTLDGNDVPASTFDNVEVSPNEHVLVVEHAGYEPTTSKVVIASGEHRTATIALHPKRGHVHVVAAKKETPIEIDRKTMGTGEWTGELDEGDHDVRLVGEGDAIVVRVVADEETVFDRSHVEPPKPPASVVPPAKPTKEMGVYVVVEGGGLYPTRLPSAYQAHDLTLDEAANNFGALGGFRTGYRVNTFAAFEGLFQYSNVTGGRQRAPGATTDPSEYSFSSWRLGPMLRLMSPGKIVKFVGSIGGGLAFHSIRFQNTELDAACSIMGSTGTVANQCVDGWGVDFFASTDAGIEFAIGSVLIGASLDLAVDSTKDTESFGDHGGIKNISPPYANESLVLLGPLLHFGYAFW